MKIKEYVLNKFKLFLTNNINNISQEELEISLYGMEVIYSFITKLIIYLIISIILNCVKEFLIVYLVLGTLRSTSFGFHADSEISCYLSSFAVLFGSIFIASHIEINIIVKAIVCIISFIMTVLYAPADTEKRPLLNKNTRNILKLCSSITVIFFSLITIFNTGFMANTIICILIINSISISPLLYKLFKRRYRNYEYY